MPLPWKVASGSRWIKFGINHEFAFVAYKQVFNSPQQETVMKHQDANTSLPQNETRYFKGHVIAI